MIRRQGGRRLTYRVGLLRASSHMALGVLVGLDQQLDEAGDDRCLLQWGMVGWAQGQIPDQADGCLVRKRKTIRGISWASGGSQFPSIISSPIISLSSRPVTDMLEGSPENKTTSAHVPYSTGSVSSHVSPC